MENSFWYSLKRIQRIVAANTNKYVFTKSTYYILFQNANFTFYATPHRNIEYIYMFYECLNKWANSTTIM